MAVVTALGLLLQVGLTPLALAQESAVATARALTDSANASIGSGDARTARRLAREAIELLLASDSAPEEKGFDSVLFDAGRVAEATGDLANAKRALSPVLERLTTTREDDDASLRLVRVTLAGVEFQLGELDVSRALYAKLVEVDERTLSSDDVRLWTARSNLAVVLQAAGALAEARALQERVLEFAARPDPEDADFLQESRINLAVTVASQGEHARARELLEPAIEALVHTRPDDDSALQLARSNLAGSLEAQGDLSRARSLLQHVHDTWSRTLPDAHPDLQRVRTNLAIVLAALGDRPGARALHEKALEVWSRTLPEDHPDLQRGRLNLAVELRAAGDEAGATALEARVLEVWSRTLPDDHPDLQRARVAVAATLRKHGDFAGARSLGELALAVLEASRPDGDSRLRNAREELAETFRAQGEFEKARDLQERALASLARALPEDDATLQQARISLAVMIALQAATADAPREAERARCVELVRAACESSTRDAKRAILTSSRREAEERCARLAHRVDTALSFARGFGVFAPSPELFVPALRLSEATRGAALASAAIARRSSASPRAAELRDALARASAELTALARAGAGDAEFEAARSARDAVERALVDLSREIGGAAEGADALDIDGFARRIGSGAAAIAYRRFRDARVESDANSGRRIVDGDRLGAFVVRGTTANAGGALEFVDLGPIEPIERVLDGRNRGTPDTILRGARLPAAGDAISPEDRRGLRALVFDALLPALGDVRSLVIVPDDVLHLVPLDALALETPGEVVGDRWRIELRTTLAERFEADRSPASGDLLALGGAAFGGDEPSVAFAPLPKTRDEVAGIGDLYREAFGVDASASVLVGVDASRAALVERSPYARFLHVATHGWYAPESIPSWGDDTPIDAKTGLGARLTGDQQVLGMSPLLLCGLALAGANLPDDAAGRAPGRITAEEIATLDLSHCELAVLSACETNVGARRAGQGVASLQRALQIAGARSVITSLWSVPDAPTTELMLEFYRQLWVEKQSKHQALWEAKRTLREAKDASGHPHYTTRDWAAWVLTGDQD